MVLHSYDKNGLFIVHSSDDTPDPFSYPMHAHDVCELYYFMHGSGYYTVEGANYPLEPGTILMMREGEMHALHIDPSQRYERITVNFPYEAVDPNREWDALRSLLYDRELGTCNLTRTGASGEYLRILFDRLCDASLVEESSGDFEVKHLFLALLSELVAIHRRNPHAHDIPDGAAFDLKIDDVGRTEAMIVLEIIGYINAHLFDIENLSEIEARFYFSRSYINRIFKAATGSSVWNYVLLKRLIAAQSMLKSGVPAAIAATKCGFNDYSSFYKQYKNKLGVAPTCERHGTPSDLSNDRNLAVNHG